MSTTDHIVAEHLVAYVDGDLDAAQAARVSAHLDACARCDAHVADLRALDVRVERAWPRVRAREHAKAPEHLVAKMEAKLSVLLNTRLRPPLAMFAPAPRRRIGRHVAVLAAAAVLLTTITLSFSVHPAGPLCTTRLHTYQSHTVLRGGGGEQRFYLEIELEQRAHLTILSLAADGAIGVFSPHPIWGDFGLGSELPVHQRVRLPPSALQDDVLPRDCELLVIPNAQPFDGGVERVAAEAARVILGLATATERRQKLTVWLADRYPGARLVAPQP